MNYLAHAYLSFDNDEILVGNFIGDFVKGKALLTYRPGIRNGILLHREIDRFTDSHPLVKAGQSYLRPKFRHYATVITDIYFDYFLAKFWDNYKDEPLEDFAQRTYLTLSRYGEDLPVKFTELLFWMKRDNWLLNYREMEGIHKTLTGMSRRTRFDSKMEQAQEYLAEKEDEFQVIFLAFFADLETFAKEKLQELQNSNARN